MNTYKHLLCARPSCKHSIVLTVGFPGDTAVKYLPANTGGIGDVSSIPGSERYPGGGNARCSSILAWRIPRTEAGYSLWDHRESDTTEHTYFIYI